ncbi:MAG: GAF domain-containing sensor histidine kinase [Anaerolineae bacterium]|jgi:signal transduction histidine kinase|nr:GAF domain-containing sensor histidine kinase [Anaerolineae bacterium]MDH7474400.1 GAF domain-containing sensor histidine kinase [Anaerolineae bacterium]
MADQNETSQARVVGLMALLDVARTVTSELNLTKLLRKIIHAAVEVLDATTGSLLIWDPNTDELVFAVAEKGMGKSLEQRRMPADKGIAGWVFTRCEPLIVGDVQQDPRFFGEIDEKFHTVSLIAVPMMTPTEKIGVIEVLNKRSGEHFDQQDLDLLSALAAQAAVAIVNARLYQELEDEKNRILAVESEAQKRLARDLHDGPAQTLAAMIMNIGFIQTLLQRDPSRVPEELEKLQQIATKALSQVRNALFELRPVILETQGLQAALESYVERLRTTEGMTIHLNVRGLDERVPAKVEQICFAIVQEAVGNIKKHAEAKQVWIGVERRAKDLIVGIRDDGKGFDVTAVESKYDQRGSLGLLNMKERAELVGGQLTIESSPGRGTLVSLIVPLDGAPKNRRKGTGPLISSQE